jgi:SecD/SecF fusion protein
MKTNTLQRLLVVLGVTLVSLWLIFPTIRYFLAISGTVPVSAEKLQELRANSVPLGLDLQGGVDVLLAVDTAKTRESKVQDVADSIRRNFTQESPSIEGSVEPTSGTAEIKVTVTRPEQVRSAEMVLEKLANAGNFKDFSAGSLKANQPLTLKVDPSLLAQDMSQTVDTTVKVIRDRVDNLGVTQPIIVKQGTDRIRVQIPGEKDPKKAIATMIRPAKLEFKGVLVGQKPGPDGKTFPDASSNYIDIHTGKLLAGKTVPPGYEIRPYKRNAKDPANPTKSSIDYIIVKKRAEMDGSTLSDARVGVSQAGVKAGEVQVLVTFNKVGAKKFDEVSEEYKGKPLAVVLDGIVYTAPTIQERISQGNCEITGSFTQDEARDLTLVLKAGALPAELITKDMRTVEATLGADSITKSIFALLLGSVIVAVYMIAYYGMAGVVAVLAVILNVLLIFAFMKLASATLTLSGIGGILLTVGMAVDANVLIYERIREELRAGRPLKQAIQLGFGRAFSVIFDANLTTLISGLVLLQFGEGSVKGFALSLNVGIIATLFTGLFVTKTLVDVWFELRNGISFGKLQWFKHDVHIDFIGLRKYSYTFSSVLFIICALYVLPFKPFHGSNWGVDFEGGLLSEVIAKKAVTAQDVQGKNEDWRVQKVAGEEKYLVRTKLVGDESLAQAKEDVEKGLDKNLGSGQYTIGSSEAVSNEVGREFTSKALLACILASIGILIYMAFRFEFAYGFTAVVALFHDLIITYGLFNMLGEIKWAGEITLDVVAALLVILGYSVNDTIIIFDRVRENKKLHPGMDDRNLINLSISESLNRTVMTVSTVVIVLVIMLVFGGSGLYDFALVLLIGITKGTYSSSFVASPLLYQIHEYERKKKLETAGARKTAKA